MARRSTAPTADAEQTTQSALWADTASVDTPTEDLDSILARVMDRLGLTVSLTYERQYLPLARIIIPGRRHLRSVAGYARNIKLVGVLHDPAVTPITGSNEFQAIFGRHRLAGALEAGSESEWVRVYPALDHRIVAFLRLSEQRRRATHWLSELEAVIEVVDESVGLTEQELAVSLGVPVRTLREYVKIARLPFLLRETVLGGTLDQATARMLIRMPKTQLDVLEARAGADEIIDAAAVHQMQHQRYTASLAQIPLATEPPVLTTPAPETLAQQETLRHEAALLQRQLDPFQRLLADTSLPNGQRLLLSCRMLAQELRVLNQTALSQEGGAA